MKNLRQLLQTGLLLMFAISFSANAQTPVSGGIYSNTTWTLTNSPYIVTDTVVVFPGVTLTIEPGVVVKFENDKFLEIRQANLVAQGTATDSITFTSDSTTPAAGSWKTILLEGAPNPITFNYCNFKYAVAAITSYSSNITIKNSIFNYNTYGYDNHSSYGLCLFDSCNFNNNTFGIQNFHGTADFCVFSYNQKGIFYADHCTFINCILNHNDKGILELSFSKVINCTIHNNQTGIELPSTSNINNCIIDSNYIGLQNSSHDTIQYCQIKYNDTGIEYLSGGLTTKNEIEYNNIGITTCSKDFLCYCNKFCNNTSYDLNYCSLYNTSIANNYWCTTDSAAIEGRIYDGYDNISYGLVSFMPIDTAQCYLDSTCSAYFYLYPDTAPHTYIAVNMASGVPPLAYTWSWGDGTFDYIPYPSHTYSTAGFYIICLTITDSTGCTSVYCDNPYLSKDINTMIYVNVISAAGLSEISNNKSFSIFPNPANDHLTLTFSQNISKAEIKIYDLLGQIESSSIITSSKSGIDISALSRGVYILELATEKNIVRQKFIKQ